MDVKINLRIITKNHAAEIGSRLKSILGPIGLTSPTRQSGSEMKKPDKIVNNIYIEIFYLEILKTFHIFKCKSFFI